MSHDLPDTKKEAPEALGVFMQWTAGFEATPEEIEEFKNLLTLPFEELEIEIYNLNDEAEGVARQIAEATGPEDPELDKLNTGLWRKLAVCTAAITAKHLGTYNI